MWMQKISMEKLHYILLQKRVNMIKIDQVNYYYTRKYDVLQYSLFVRFLGYASIVKLLIENGAEIEKKYQKTGVTPLFFSIGSSQGSFI